MESELQAFLDDAIDSLIKLEVVLFLHDNPGTIDTADGIAGRIYRDKQLTARALDELCSKGVVECATLGAGVYQLYSLCKDEVRRRLIKKLDEGYHSDGTMRIEIIRRFITKKNPVAP